VRTLIEVVVVLGIIPYLERGLSLPLEQREQTLHPSSKQSECGHQSTSLSTFVVVVVVVVVVVLTDIRIFSFEISSSICNQSSNDDIRSFDGDDTSVGGTM
jgi:hypothetical protein